MHIQSTTLATAATTVSVVACTITKIQGSKLAANDRYLQLHDTKATPANAAVPTRVWPIYGTAPFGEAFLAQPVALVNGATFVVSTTQNTYTATAETVDITVDGWAVIDLTGATIVGDYTTGTPGETPWADGAGPKTLLRLEFTALTDAGATLYAKVFASTAATVAGDLPLVQVALPRLTSKDFMFNLRPKVTKNNTLYQGCVVAIDSTAGAYDGTYAGSDFAIRCTSI